jgi:hypothetical protein
LFAIVYVREAFPAAVALAEELSIPISHDVESPVTEHVKLFVSVLLWLYEGVVIPASRFDTEVLAAPLV